MRKNIVLLSLALFFLGAPVHAQGEFSNEQLLSDDFIHELSAIEVSKAADCKPKK